jgi:hypothetical protein
MEITIQNSKHYKPYDGSDNPCCWQVDALTEDMDDIFDRLGIKYEVMPDDWGTAYSWLGKDAEFWMQVECSDTDTCQFQITLGASRKWLGIFSRQVTNPEELCADLLSELRRLDEPPRSE